MTAVALPASLPTGSLDKWAVLDHVGWDPHPAQLKIAESTARNRVVSAGRRMGKSNIGGFELVPEALITKTQANYLAEQGKRREFWIVGPTYSDSEKEFRVLWNTLSRLEVPFDKPGSYNNPVMGSLHISLWGGTFQVHGKSAKYPEQLVGEGLCGVIMAEAAKLKERIWTKFIRPTLSDFEGWALFTSTPEGKNWFYDFWRKGQDPLLPEWESWRMPAWLNPYVYKTPTKRADVRALQEIMRNEQVDAPLTEMAERHGFVIDREILALMEDATIEAFNQEIGAEFTEFVGRVFKEFDEEIHVRRLFFNPAWETYAGVDYGFVHPNVWLLIQVGPWNEVNVLDEVYMEGLTANEFADIIASRGLAPAGMGCFYPDPEAPGDTRILENRLKVRARGGTGGLLRHRIDAIRASLKEEPLHVPRGHEDRRPHLLIDPKCERLIDDMGLYRYPEKRETTGWKGHEKPMDKDDHGPEALGRFFAGYFGTPQNPLSEHRVTRAKVRRR